MGDGKRPFLLTGTGSCGTRLFARIFQGLGLSPARARCMGSEYPLWKSALDVPPWVPITPEFDFYNTPHYINSHLGWWWENRDRVDGVVIPIRDYEQAFMSIVKNKLATHGPPGSEQGILSMLAGVGLFFTHVTRLGIPVFPLPFPECFESPESMWNQMDVLLGHRGVTRERFLEEVAKHFDPGKIHRYSIPEKVEEK